MALNVKAAMAICMAYIGVLTWLVQQIRAPQVDLPPRAAFVQARTLPMAAADEAGVGRILDDRRTGWVQALERPNPLEMQAAANEAGATALALVEEVPAELDALPPLGLPPLVYDQPAIAELPVASGDDLVLASAEGEAAGGPAYGAGAAWPTDEVVVAAPAKYYRVARGDTLMSIVRREWKSTDPQLMKRLVEANPQLARRPNRLRIGEQLLIPDRSAAGSLAAARPSASPAGPTRGAAAGAPGETPAPRWYTIQRKDSLTSIARRCLNDARRWREIMTLNGLADPNKLQAGRRIRLPSTVELASR